MSALRLAFDASPVMDTNKTGVGYFTLGLLTGMGEVHGQDLELTGYYFDFLGHGHKQPPDVPGVRFHKIWLVPGKLLSVSRRMGFQVPFEFFVPKRFNAVLFPNFVSLPTLNNCLKIVVIHDLGFLDCPEYVQTTNLKFLRKFCPASIRNADIIITVSRFTESRIKHHFPDLKTPIIVTPIPPPPSTIKGTGPQPPARLSKRLTELGIMGDRYILFLGTIEPRKNLEVLIKAYSLLDASQQKQYALVLAGGKGWHNQKVLDAISGARSHGLQIINTGYVTDREKNELYTNAACSVQLSHYEGFGMPILEALQYRLPVLVSDIAVFHEVAGDAVLYCNKDDPIDTASALSRILSDTRLRRQLIDRSSQLLGQLDWRKNASQIFKALGVKPR